MTEDEKDIQYLKCKYEVLTWENMLAECKEWYKQGLKQGKFDKEMEEENDKNNK